MTPAADFLEKCRFRYYTDAALAAATERVALLIEQGASEHPVLPTLDDEQMVVLRLGISATLAISAMEAAGEKVL